MSVMPCAYCSKKKNYTKDFPDILYAICAECYPLWTAPTPGLLQRFVRWWKR